VKEEESGGATQDVKALSDVKAEGGGQLGGCTGIFQVRVFSAS
jgi:hypothetical protein